MDRARGGGGQQQDDRLPAWVLPVCLVLTAVACALLLRVTIAVMTDEPARTTPVTARPTP